MKPYYEHAGITIYHGDCREVLRGLEVHDLVLTDPPYGIGKWSSTGGNSITPEQAAAAERWDVLPDDDTLRMVVAMGDEAIVWGGQYLCHALGNWRSPLVWDKGIRGMHYAEGEIAWTSFKHGTLRVLNFPISSSDSFGCKVHPTQKPVQVMSWCLSQVPAAQTILDPFMGSGTTLVAAKLLGRNGVGIESEESYCEIAAKRLAQEVLPL